MTRLISILTIVLLTSCSSYHDKQEVIKNLTEIKELNEILISKHEELDWKNDPATISSKIPQTRDLIQLLSNKLNLTEIEFHKKIDGNADHLGFAYRFGNPSKEMNYSYLIFTQNLDDLEKFRHYEQFVDCGKSVIIEKKWAFSRITVDCNN